MSYMFLVEGELFAEIFCRQPSVCAQTETKVPWPGSVSSSQRIGSFGTLLRACSPKASLERPSVVSYVKHSLYPCSAMRVRLGFWKGLHYNGWYQRDGRGD